MSLINVSLTSNNITPPISNLDDINNTLFYCDLSGSGLSNDVFSLKLNPSNNNNLSNSSVLKINVLFRNNGLNPTINTLIMNNIPTTNFFKNNMDTSISQMTNQEFIITYSAGTYTSISTIRKYD
jgi:hypothetical protein